MAAWFYEYIFLALYLAQAAELIKLFEKVTLLS